MWPDGSSPSLPPARMSSLWPPLPRSAPSHPELAPCWQNSAGAGLTYLWAPLAHLGILSSQPQGFMIPVRQGTWTVPWVGFFVVAVLSFKNMNMMQTFALQALLEAH